MIAPVARPVIAVDPGSVESAWVEVEGDRVTKFGKWPNVEVLTKLRWRPNAEHWHLAVEMIASYGMPVGAEVFETCVWIGRFVEAWSSRGGDYSLVYRRDVKMHVCGSARAKDGNVRTALIDRWGGKAAAVGKKKSPGPLYGVSADVWQALGVAVTWAERHAPLGAGGGE